MPRSSATEAGDSSCLITVIVAGTNDASNADHLADAFIEGMISVNGVTCEKVRLKDCSLSHFTLKCYDNAHACAEPDFARIKTLMQESSGIVFASPIWNFSVPAHFKNLIDRIGSFALDAATHSEGQLHGKPFALLYTGGAPMIAWKALMYLTTLHVSEALKYYGGAVIFRHFEPKCMPKKGEFGLVVDKRPAILKHMRASGASFARCTSHYARHGKLPWRHQVFHKWFEFLYRVGNRIMYPISELQ